MDPLDTYDLLCLDLERAEALRARLDAVEIERAAARARAFGDPTRLTLAKALAGADELCVCDLAWIVGRPLNLVSHHLRVLRDAGLASSRREHKMVFHSLTWHGQELLASVTANLRAGVA